MGATTAELVLHATEAEELKVDGMDQPQTKTAAIFEANMLSLQARPWTQPGYRFRPVSQHDQEGHDFRSNHPYLGWVDVRVDDITLTMFSNSDDGVAMVYHAFGPDAYEAASIGAWTEIAKNAAKVADVGSFTGLYAMIAQLASPNASVIAIEPNSAARARLFINLYANGLYPQLKVSPLAVSNDLGTIALHIAWGPDILDTGSSLSAPLNAPSWLPIRTEIVTSAPLDLIFEKNKFHGIDLIKIDVEGLEDIVLAGASNTLLKQPTLLLEIQSSEKFAKCYETLSAHGYKILAIDDEEVKFVKYDGQQIEKWFSDHVGHRVMNYLCVARSEHEELAERGLQRIREKMT